MRNAICEMRNGSVIATTNDAMPSCTRPPPSLDLPPPLQPQSLLLVGMQACGDAMSDHCMKLSRIFLG